MSTEPFEIVSDYHSIEDEEVFKRLLSVLMSFAYKLIGNSTLRLEKNRADLAYDMSMEAIKRYLSNPEKFDSARNPDLVKYLKFNILRRLIDNHKKLSGQKNEELWEPDSPNSEEIYSAMGILSPIESLVDLNAILQEIRQELNEEPELSVLFEMRYVEDYSRKEIIEELGLTDYEYNNRIRRLNTVRKRVLLKFTS